MTKVSSLANALIGLGLYVVQGQNLLEVPTPQNSGPDRAPPRELFGSACQVFDHLAPEGSDLETICSLMPPLYFSYLALAGVSPTTVEEKFDDCLREFEGGNRQSLSYAGLKRCVKDDEEADDRIEGKWLR